MHKGSIGRYFNPTTFSYMSLERYNTYKGSPATQHKITDYIPMHEYKRKIGWNDYFTKLGGDLELRLHSLYVDFRSRYEKIHKGLWKLYKIGLFDNQSSKDPDTQDFAKFVRRRLNHETRDHKNRLVPDWKIKNYDWNMVLSGEFAMDFYNRAKNTDWGHEQPYKDHIPYNTVITTGIVNPESKSKPIKVRVYNMKHTSTPGQDLIKIEISFRKDFLKNNKRKKDKEGNPLPDLRQPNNYRKQWDIQAMFRKEIKNQLRAIFRATGYYDDPTLLNNLMEFVGVTNKAKIWDEVTEEKHTLEYIKDELRGCQNPAELKRIKEKEDQQIIDSFIPDVKNPDFPTMSEIRRKRELETQELNNALFAKPVNSFISEEVDNSLDAYF